MVLGTNSSRCPFDIASLKIRLCREDLSVPAYLKQTIKIIWNTRHTFWDIIVGREHSGCMEQKNVLVHGNTLLAAESTSDQVITVQAERGGTCPDRIRDKVLKASVVAECSCYTELRSLGLRIVV